MDKEDWNKFVKVFNLDVGVTVKKVVSKSDVILALLDEGEIAFRGFNGDCFVMKINDKFDLNLVEALIWEPIKKHLAKLKEKRREETIKETLKQKEKLKRGCGVMFCEDCGSYNAEDEGHNLGCTEGNLGNVSCGTKDLEDELKLCPTCSAKIEELEALKSGVSHG
jgi:hypothetical protein